MGDRGGAGNGFSIVTKPMGQMVAALSRFGQKLFQAPQDTIRGIEDTWPSPLQPMRPLGPEGTQPKQFEFWQGQNLINTPRTDAEYTAPDLKDLASYPLARICIENVKDSLCRIPWEIQAIRRPDESKKDLQTRTAGDTNLKKLNKFFERPDREHDWTEWLRPLLEDLLVIDAPTVLIRKTFKGQIVELPVLRGESIVRYVDQNGFTPMPPSPAFAQNWWGLPLVDLTTDQLVYKPRNIVPRNTMSSQLYGMSPTEQLATEIKIGQKRLDFTLAYYTEGSVPGVVQVIPPGTPTDKISEAMQWMNSELAGNLAARRQWRMVQGFQEMGHADQILMTKEPLLADTFDDMHIRKIAFGYGTSAQRLLRMMNRASSQSNQDAAEEEGTLCYLGFLKSYIGYIIQTKFGYPDYEIVFDPSQEPDAQKQAEVVTTLVGKAILTPNEGRERLGEEPRSEPEANELGIIAATGFIPIGQAKEVAQAQMDAQAKTADAATEAAKHPPVVSGGNENKGAQRGANGGGQSKKAPATAKANGTNGHGNGATWAHCGSHASFVSTCGDCSAVIRKQFEEEKQEALAKVEQPKIQPGRLHPNSILAKHKLEKYLNTMFDRMNGKCAKLIAKATEKTEKLAKASSQDELLKAILKSLRAEWRALGDEALDPIETAAVTGAANGSLQLDITDEGMLGKVNQTARDWAAKRAAELVGMRNEEGVLVENPDAKWAISDTTRDELRNIIKNVFDRERASMADIEAEIQTAGTFSEARATMIARTEIARAQVQGNLDTWKVSGLVKSVNWKMSANHDQDDLCDENELNGPYELEEVPDFPAHPNCVCALVIAQVET